MRVFKNHHFCEDPINFLGFEELEHLIPECVEFYYGGHANNKVFDPSDKKKIFFSTEEQLWEKDSTNQFVDYVEKILTICPNSNRDKRELCFFPFNEDYIQPETEKVFDVIYTGSIDRHIENEIPILTKFNHALVSFSGDPRVNFRGVGYLDKLKLISMSKATICHSLTNNYTESNPSVQVKTRYFEASFNKSIILCKRDSVNVIEEFFEPGKEFVYFDSPGDLEEKISDISKNYESYLPIIEAAHSKAVNNYTTRHFIEKYLQKYGNS